MNCLLWQRVARKDRYTSILPDLFPQLEFYHNGVGSCFLPTESCQCSIGVKSEDRESHSHIGSVILFLIKAFSDLSCPGDSINNHFHQDRNGSLKDLDSRSE